MVKDGAALERLAEVDHRRLRQDRNADRGPPRLIADAIDRRCWRSPRRIAATRRHPYRARSPRRARACTRGRAHLVEHPGLWIARPHRHESSTASADRLGTAFGDDQGLRRSLSPDGRLLCRLSISGLAAPGRREPSPHCQARACLLEILSGDHEDRCAARVVSSVSFPIAPVESPAGQGRSTHRRAQGSGRRVLMVGDGLNDTPALAAAHVSMATAPPPTSAAMPPTSSSCAMDLVAVPRRSRFARQCPAKLVRQNLPLRRRLQCRCSAVAILGHVTPLVAAVAMSASSMLGDRPTPCGWAWLALASRSLLRERPPVGISPARRLAMEESPMTDLPLS